MVSRMRLNLKRHWRYSKFSAGPHPYGPLLLHTQSIVLRTKSYLGA
jgi:hypothetical protein